CARGWFRRSSGSDFRPRRLRSGCGPAQSVRVGEEPLLHLVGALAEDHRLHVVLGAHLLERVGGLHLLEQPGGVLAGLHLHEAHRAGEREVLVLAEDGEDVSVDLDAALFRPLVENALWNEQVVGHLTLRILSARCSSYYQSKRAGAMELTASRTGGRLAAFKGENRDGERGRSDLHRRQLPE